MQSRDQLGVCTAWCRTARVGGEQSPAQIESKNVYETRELERRPETSSSPTLAVALKAEVLEPLQEPPETEPRAWCVSRAHQTWRGDDDLAESSGTADDDGALLLSE